VKKNWKKSMEETELRTFKMSYENLEDAIISFLYSVGAIDDNVEVIGTDFGMEVDDDGMVEFDLEMVKLSRN
jgi:hypothetical protein